jgi:hypothetical protein
LSVVDRINKETGINGEHEHFPAANEADKRGKDCQLREFVVHVPSLEVAPKLEAMIVVIGEALIDLIDDKSVAGRY